MDAPRRLAGRYELRKVLGRGGMAEVYLGHDARLGRPVAVKTLLPDLARDPAFQARFRREAQSAAALNHPAVVAVYDTGEDFVDGVSTPFIVMEYVEGSTLRELLTEGGRPRPERALEVCAGVLRALEYSHQGGIVHRDIKPGNIMLTDTGQVKVMDFGIARAMGEAGLTQTAAVVGTAHYLSPEQARGENVDARSDLYSTGCLLFELLTGRPPFTGDSAVSIAYQHVNEEPKPPSAFDAAITPEAEAVVLRALAKDREHRYESAAEMRADIEAVLDGRPVAPPASPAPVAAERPTTVLRARPAATATASTPASPSAPVPAAGPAPGPPPRRQPDMGPDTGPGHGGRRRRRSRGPALVAAFVTLVLLAGAVFLGRSLLGDGDDEGGNAGGGPTVTVPDLRGMSPSKAQKEAADGDFEVVEGSRRPCVEEEGTVCATTPAAGSRIDPGGTVTLIISSGSRPVKVPDVTGDAFEDALTELQAAGFDVDQDTEETPDEEPGTVLGQDPEGGKKARPGTVVTLTVAGQPGGSGPDPSPTPGPEETEPADPDESQSPDPGETEPEALDVPDVTGLSYDDAEQRLSDVGLAADRVVSTESWGYEPDTVISQDPAGGRLPPGGLVTLTVEPPVEEVHVPDVSGRMYGDAAWAIEDAGLVPLPYSYPAQDLGCRDTDVVDYSTPGAGETVQKGDYVELYCYRPEE
ncbi:Stk1 family PASTA domain-containing Ser/Thr kinase [Streptomyces sp. 6N223]|uniref:Stk1 family PASTA domain-containing Ser/Thr kinase n=1 Tax=Streptomyces sp. 6N223 TaxID=3457412 RepID=UPI003FD171B6